MMTDWVIGCCHSPPKYEPTMLQHFRLLLAALLLCHAIPRDGLASDAPTATIRANGSAEIVFAWRTMRCATWDVPDVPARAWRDSDGRVHLVAGHPPNRAMVGPDLNRVAPDCRIILDSGRRDDPALFDDLGWIAATYSPDGRSVYALIHNEYQGHRRPDACPSGQYMKCWSNTLTLAVAHDGGYSFARPTPPLHLVATPPYKYAGEGSHPTGYFNPSNIIARDGHYYVYFWAAAQSAQSRGACLMRSDNLGDASAWRAWNGRSFAIRFADPYRGTVRNNRDHTCFPVSAERLTSFVASIVRHRPSGVHVALMAGARPNGTGIFATTSKDLLSWTDPVLIWPAALLTRFDCADAEAYFYPSLLDPGSPSRNFEDVGNQAYLYLTRIRLESCRTGPERDLIRIPIEVAIDAKNPSH